MTNTILNMFARSPIKPIQQHIWLVHRCAKGLEQFLEAVAEKDWAKAKSEYKAIGQLEDEADAIKKDIRLHMPKGLFMPIPRTDLLEIVSMQDKIANKAEDIAGLILGRQMEFPEALLPQFRTFLSRSLDATKKACKAVNELDELVETGFRGHEVTLVEEMINELDEIEDDTDKLEKALRGELFKIEQSLPPVDVIFLYKVIEWIGDLADHAEKVGASLELMLAR